MLSTVLVLTLLLVVPVTQGPLCALLCQAGAAAYTTALAYSDQQAPCKGHAAPEAPLPSRADACQACAEATPALIPQAPHDALAAPLLATLANASDHAAFLPRRSALLRVRPLQRPPPRRLLYLKSSLLL